MGTHAETCNRQNPREDLSAGVDPNETWEREDADHDGTNGKEDDKRQAHQDSMRDLLVPNFLKIDAPTRHRPRGFRALITRASRGRRSRLCASRSRRGCCRGRRDERVHRVAAGRFGQVEAEDIHVVMLVDVCRWRTVFDGGAVFRGPNP